MLRFCDDARKNNADAETLKEKNIFLTVLEPKTFLSVVSTVTMGREYREYQW